MTTPSHSTAEDAADVVALAGLADRLLSAAATAKTGRSARTVMAMPGLRATLIALNAGQELAEHDAPGSAILACLTGSVRLSTVDREWSLHQHNLLPVPAERHRLIADASSVVMLIVRLD